MSGSAAQTINTLPPYDAQRYAATPSHPHSVQINITPATFATASPRHPPSLPSRPNPTPVVKPSFWRVQNIDLNERADAIRWLREQTKGLTLSQGQGFSLAADSSRTLCATLTKVTKPIPPRRHWRVDQSFIGCTPLYDPQDTKLDIVAVTGLGGHALGSFRSADGASVWLRDFAPRDIPQARFVTYGYNTNVADSDSNEGVHELARTLLDSLDIFRRRTRSEQRPLVFICHSLGGVVLKQALVISSTATEDEHRGLHQVFLSTLGLILLGVPNLGLRHTQLCTLVEGCPNEGLIRDLVTRTDGEASQYLRSLTESFARICRLRRPPWTIISYYETLRTHTTNATGNRQWVKEGPKEFMVTQTSAERISHEIRDIDHLPSRSNHRDLVRFEHPQDDRYLSLIEKIGRYAAVDTCQPRKAKGKYREDPRDRLDPALAYMLSIDATMTPAQRATGKLPGGYNLGPEQTAEGSAGTLPSGYTLRPGYRAGRSPSRPDTLPGGYGFDFEQRWQHTASSSSVNDSDSEGA